MKLIEPWAPEAARHSIGQVAETVIGSPLTAVRYISPQLALPDRFTSFTGFDVVLKGAELSSPGHKVAIL